GLTVQTGRLFVADRCGLAGITGGLAAEVRWAFMQRRVEGDIRRAARFSRLDVFAIEEALHALLPGSGSPARKQVGRRALAYARGQRIAVFEHAFGVALLPALPHGLRCQHDLAVGAIQRPRRRVRCRSRRWRQYPDSTRQGTTARRVRGHRWE